MSNAELRKFKPNSDVLKILTFYMKRTEKENIDRVTRLKRLRKNNIITGLGLAGAVAGIYLYSIFAVKQENFLDTVDEQTK